MRSKAAFSGVSRSEYLLFSTVLFRLLCFLCEVAERSSRSHHNLNADKTEIPIRHDEDRAARGFARPGPIVCRNRYDGKYGLARSNPFRRDGRIYVTIDRSPTFCRI